jgi:hypothetical protein
MMPVNGSVAIHRFQRRLRLNREAAAYWIPAFAGTTPRVVEQRLSRQPPRRIGPRSEAGTTLIDLRAVMARSTLSRRSSASEGGCDEAIHTFLLLARRRCFATRAVRRSFAPAATNAGSVPGDWHRGRKAGAAPVSPVPVARRHGRPRARVPRRRNAGSPCCDRSASFS